MYFDDEIHMTYTFKTFEPQSWSEIIETNAKNGVVFDATSNEQPI